MPTCRSTLPALWLAFCLVAVAVIARAATYHVAPGGDDHQNGSDASPWRTLQHAANRVAAGDIVLVADGYYAGFRAVAHGTPSAPIAFIATGSSAVINRRAPNIPDGHDARITLQRDYYIIDGFVIDGEDCTQSQCIGVRIIGLGSDGTIIRNCTIQNHFTHGVQITRSTGVQVLDNTFYNNGNTDHRHGIYVAGIDEPSWCLIKGNKMYDNADGVSVGGQNAEWTVIIDGNLITGSTYMAIHLKQKARGCVIKNNVIFRQGSNPVFVHADENIITNNTIIQTNGKGIRLSSASNDNIVFNNIVVAESPASAIKDEGVSNRIHAASNIIHYAGEGGFRLDDLFVAPDRDDYHIKDGSEAHNAGTSAYLGVAATDSDFDGDLRPGGDAVDIGSDEISGRRERPRGGKDPFPHAHLMPVVQASLSQSYPNPFNPSTTIKFRVESPARVTLRIYDVTGRLIRTLVDEAMEGSAKERLAVWDGRNNDGVSVRSGVYFYRLAAGKRTETRKLLLVK